VGEVTKGRLAALGAAAAAVAVAAVLLLGRTDSAPSTAPGPPLSVRASLAPSAVLFGDRLTARIVVLLDRRTVKPASVRLVEDVAPLTALGSARVTRTARGPLEVVSYEIPVVCLSERCFAEKGVAKVALPAVRAEAARRGGGLLHATTTWTPLVVGGRVGAADLAAATPRFRVDTTPRPADYPVSPTSLARLLDLLAVALALAGAALAVWAVARVAHRRSGRQEAGPLERALRLARQAETRPADDRRRAIGLVARLLGDRDRRLAGEASDLAWSRPQPAGSAVADLVDEVERRELG
jgi:hypothetical protein